MNDLPAGRELDALVAEKVMGWSPANIAYCLPYDAPGDGECGDSYLPRYSDDIAAAWEVVDAVMSNRNVTIERYARNLWQVFIRPDAYKADHGQLYCATALTAPHAICLAALKAVGA